MIFANGHYFHSKGTNSQYSSYARFKVLTAVRSSIQIFCEVMLWTASAFRMKAQRPFETFGTLHTTTKCRITLDSKPLLAVYLYKVMFGSFNFHLTTAAATTTKTPPPPPTTPTAKTTLSFNSRLPLRRELYQNVTQAMKTDKRTFTFQMENVASKIVKFRRQKSLLEHNNAIK